MTLQLKGKINMTVNFQEKALELRKQIIKISYLAGAGHITSSLSALDILIALYLGNILRYDSANPEMPDRDRFVMSKGHGTLALYTVLCEAGFVKREDINTFCQKGSKFGGLTTASVPGVEYCTGSLGHGLPIAVGVALSARMKKQDYLTYVLTGDGECQEGSVWEAAMAIAHFNLNNLIWIIDRNHLQLSGTTESVMKLEPLEQKLCAFGFAPLIINGHNYADLFAAMQFDRKHPPQKPIAIIANTVKGKGVPLLENQLGWHNRRPNQDEWNMIIEQLGMSWEVFETI